MSSLEPAASPASTRSVFEVTEDWQVPPFASISACASLRLYVGRVPVSTTNLPANTPSSATFLDFRVINESNLASSALLSPSLNQFTIVSAVTSPILSRASSASLSASASEAILPKACARSAAATLPTPSMPSANINLSGGITLLFSMELSRFSAFLSLNPSSSRSLSFVSEYSSEAYFSPNLSCNNSAVFSEKPSISIASLQAKCASLATILGRQSLLGQNMFAPTSESGVPQNGQTVGLGISQLPSVCSTVPSISGMTSLERRISTLLPDLTPLRIMSP